MAFYLHSARGTESTLMYCLYLYLSVYISIYTYIGIHSLLWACVKQKQYSDWKVARGNAI